MVSTFAAVVHYRDRTTQSLYIDDSEKHLTWLRRRIRSGENPETVFHGWEDRIKVCEVVDFNFHPSPVDTKTCTRCGEVKERGSNYHRSRSSGDGFDPRCKACKTKQAKVYWATNRDRLLEKGRRYQEQNREYFREYNRRYRKKVKDARS